MTRYTRKKTNQGYKRFGKQCKTKHKTKDYDEIDTDLKPDNAEKLLNQEIDHDLPGSGQNYCLHCARHFIDKHALTEHFRTKVHKRRLKALETEPYSQEEAEAAAGIGNYIAPKRRKMETQASKVEGVLETHSKKTEVVEIK